MGLLTPGAFGKSPLAGKPKAYPEPKAGLLKRVVLRNVMGRTPSDRPGEEALEGGGIGPRGGGGGSRSFGSHGTARPDPAGGGWEITHVPGRGEVRSKTYPKEGGWTPRFQNLTPLRPGERPSSYGRDQYTVVETPSGQTIRFDQYSSGRTSVTFGRTSYESGPPPKEGIKGTAETFGHVMKAMRDYARIYKPKELKFYGATDVHQKLYDRATPQLAEGLGAVHSRDGRYHILTFPEGWDK